MRSSENRGGGALIAPAPPGEDLIHQVALSIRRRHLLFTLRELRRTNAELRSVERSRSKRARLLRLARKHGLAGCQSRLRSPGMTIETEWEPPCFRFDRGTLKERRLDLRERIEVLRRESRTIKSQSLDAMTGSLRTLFEETGLLGSAPARVRFIVDSVELKGVHIGDLEVTFSLEGFEVKVINLTEDTGSKGGYQHPHVNSLGLICWSEHLAEARAYHASGDFLALKDLIENLLRTYNKESPYITLEDWENGLGESCSDCGERRNGDDLSYSSQGGGSLCSDCRRYCERCDEHVPDRCFDTEFDACEACVEADTRPCAFCEERFWEDELQSISIKVGDDGVDGGKEVTTTRRACSSCARDQLNPNERKEETDEQHDGSDDDYTDPPSLLASPMDVPTNA